ncbi:MAG: MBL fold metallo-hydrolase [Desulfobulbus propionicus]|nr:MAG: MBL fold metallo-hydrolase [Desulfobulbus propionicus]
MFEIFADQSHKNICLHDLSEGHMVETNQHIIVHGDQMVCLDPGGHKVFNKLFKQMSSIGPLRNIKYIFFSHQDPDIVAAANGWLMTTDAKGFLPAVWMKFITHFGVDTMVIDRITPIKDEGMVIDLNGCPLKVIPAHFLHSPGNYHIYDPISKILYSGDLGASVDAEIVVVEDFDHHIQFMEGFHKRYMPSTKALKMWVNTARELDIETIAPQHGSLFKGREMVNRFIDWIDSLECGVDLMGDRFLIPE